MINIKWRLDLLGLSTDEKPINNLENGSTFYTVDEQELYIFLDGTWYKQNPIETVVETHSENQNRIEEKTIILEPKNEIEPELIKEDSKEIEPELVEVKEETKKAGDENA